MAVLSNNGRLISSLPLTSQVLGNDELLLQSNGVTKRVRYSALTSSILKSNTFNPYGSTVNFNAQSTNKFSGSFYSQNNKLANFAVVNVRQGITVAGVSTLDTVVATTFNGNFLGPLTGDVTSTGISTFSGIDVNGGTIDGTAIGNTVQSTIRGTKITASLGINGAQIRGTKISASLGFNGSLIGPVKGDIYSHNGNIVLENGTSANPNGNIPNAFFYGTSSYANQALTSAYSIASAAGVTETQAKSYVTTSMNSNGGLVNRIPKFSGPSKLGLSLISDNGTNVDISTYLSVTGKVVAQSFSGSFYGGPGGFKKQGTKYVSFWGTGSYAVTASYVDSLTPVVNTSTGTVSDFLGGTNEGGVGTYCYAITHGFGTTPSSIRATLYCNSDDAGPGYSSGDEVDLNTIESDQLDANTFSTWTNSTYAAVSIAGNTGFPNNLYIPAKTGGTWNTIDSTKWKIKIRVWK